MQFTIDENTLQQAAQWFDDNPWRLILPYLAMSLAVGVKKSREVARHLYTEIRNHRSSVPPYVFPNEVAVVGGTGLTLLSSPFWMPFYVVWRAVRVGLGPIPANGDKKA